MTITRRRPGFPPSYGIATDEAGMLDWAEVSGAIADAEIFWVTTVTPDGGPHLIPIWGAWAGDAAYFEGGEDTRWARNLAAGDGRTHIGIDHGRMQVMVRGAAQRVDVDEATQSAVADGYEAKYPYRPTGTAFWRVTPTSVLAWKINDLDAFAATPTQFDFGGSR